MKPHQLKAFLAVCEQGSIRSAARVLFISQPAVTRTLRELETDLGVPLIARSSRGATLTHYGQAFAVRARLILEESQRARDELAQLRSQQVGRVRLAASSLPAALLLPPALQAFRRAMPLAQIEVVDGQVPTATAELRQGSLDFALSQHVPERLDADLQHEVLFSAPLVFCASTTHPHIASRKLADLIDDEWVGMDRAMIHRIFERHGLPPPARITTCPSFEIARGLVQSANGITVFALPMIEHTLARHGVGVIPLQERLPELPLSVVTRRGAVLTPAAQLLLDAVRAVAVARG